MPKIIDEDAVFQAVVSLLIARGYDGATTAALAEAAGMHEATLFRKYGSKAALIVQAIAHQLSTTPMNEVAYTGDLHADLLQILQAYLATVERHGEIMPLILVEMPRHPELKGILRTPLANLHVIMDILVRYQQAGALQEEHPLITVNSLLGPLMAHGMVSRAGEETAVPPFDLNLEAYRDAFLYGRIKT